MPAVEGVLKGYDLLLNLVLDDCIEFLQGAISLSFILVCVSLSSLRACACPSTLHLQHWLLMKDLTVLCVAYMAMGCQSYALHVERQ